MGKRSSSQAVAHLQYVAYPAGRPPPKLTLPDFGGRLLWADGTSPSAPLRSKSIFTVVVAPGPRADLAAKRVAELRNRGQTAVGIALGRGSPVAGTNGVARLARVRDADALLACLAAILCEGVPEVFVCIDWNDVADLLDEPGEPVFEHAAGTNRQAFAAALARLRRRVGSRRELRGVVCLYGGGAHFRFLDAKHTLKSLRNLTAPCAEVHVADRLLPFAGGPGCCILAVVAAVPGETRFSAGE